MAEIQNIARNMDEERGEKKPLVSTEEFQLVGFRDDAIDTIKLGGPIFVAMLSWVGVGSSETRL